MKFLSLQCRLRADFGLASQARFFGRFLCIQKPRWFFIRTLRTYCTDRIQLAELACREAFLGGFGHTGAIGLEFVFCQ